MKMMRIRKMMVMMMIWNIFQIVVRYIAFLPLKTLHPLTIFCQKMTLVLT